MSVPARAQSASLESAVKATFVTKFAPFVSWPPTSFPLPGSSFNICLLGSDAVSDLIEQAAAGQSIEDRPIVAHHVVGNASFSACQILYVAKTETNAAQALAASKGVPILTVTDAEGANTRGIINFVVVDNHVRFDIDDSEAARSNLTISSKMLALAHDVVPRPQGRKL